MIIKHLLDERASTIYLLQDCFWGFESDFNKKKKINFFYFKIFLFVNFFDMLILKINF